MKGQAKAKAKAVSGGGGFGPSHLLAIGFVLYVVAWFVPAYRGQELFGAFGSWTKDLGAQGARAPQDTGWLHGWSACRFAWDVLVGEASGEDAWRSRLVGSSCLTNLVMLFAMVRVAMRRAGIGTGLALLACVAVNASWIYLSDENPFDVYAAGYFLWLASFALVSLGLLMRER